jgi:hypothetical protein
VLTLNIKFNQRAKNGLKTNVWDFGEDQIIIISIIEKVALNGGKSVGWFFFVH